MQNELHTMCNDENAVRKTFEWSCCNRKRKRASAAPAAATQAMSNGFLIYFLTCSSIQIGHSMCEISRNTFTRWKVPCYEHAQNHILLDKREMFCVPLLLFLQLLLKNIASASTWHSALASAVHISTAQHSTRVQHGIQYDFCIAKGQYAWKFECKNFTLAVHRKWCAKKHKPSEVQVVNCNVYALCLNLEAKKYREKWW